MKVLIDCGHGGMKDGQYVTAPSKMYDHGDFVFYEGVFNRQLGFKIAEELNKLNIDYEFIVKNNDDTSLATRVRRANSIGKLSDCIYLSVHGNAAGVESASGIEIWTSPGQTESDIIAEYIYEELSGMGWKMRSDRSDGDHDKESKFYVLMKTTMPAILVEYGFFTNRGEALKMLDEHLQRKLAKLTVKGIIRYETKRKN